MCRSVSAAAVVLRALALALTTTLMVGHLHDPGRDGPAAAHAATGPMWTGPSRDAVPLVGDWNGNGRQTPGWFDRGVVYLRNSNTAGQPDAVFTYGRRGDVPIVGDWNGNGRDTIGVVRSGQWHLRNSNSSGPANLTFRYGRVAAGDYPLAGDWNGDGRDTVGIVRGGIWYLRLTNAGGAADIAFRYGRVTSGDVPLVGDWNGDGRDTPAIVRGRDWHLRFVNRSGAADATFRYGQAADTPVAGMWTKSGVTTPGRVRASLWMQRHRNQPGAPDVQFAFPSDTPPAPRPDPIEPPFAGATVYVSRQAGSDTNPGTKDRPVRTIVRGLQLAEQHVNKGTAARVLVERGVYRESVMLAAKSEAQAHLVIEGQAGAVISGADVWTEWTQQPDGSFAAPWPHKWGSKPIPPGWEGYWNWDGKGRQRDVLRRSEQVFVNGRPLRAVLRSSELTAGTFFVDEGAARLHLRLPTGQTMSSATIEVATRFPVLRINGRRNVTVRGLTIERGRGAVQDTAAYVTNSHAITLEDVTVRQHGYGGFGTSDTTGLRIRSSRFVDNGVTGLGAHRDTDVVVEDSLVAGNNWRGAAANHTGWDSVHKWGLVRDGVIRRTRFVNNHGSGLWLDWDNRRILAEDIVSANNLGRGIYLEANPGPVTIRRATVCNNGLSGISDARSDNVTIHHSQIFGNASWQWLFTGQPNPVQIRDWQTGRITTVASRNWQFTDNIVTSQNREGWLVQVDHPDIYPFVRDTIISNRNTWHHHNHMRPFRLPTTEGGNVDHATFRQRLSRVRANEQQSSYRSPGTLHCPAS